MPRHPAQSPAAHGLSSSVYTSLLALARTHAEEVFALNVGDTYLLPAACARAEALHTSDLPGLHNYAEVQGEPALLDAIVEDLRERGRGVERARIQVTCGATSGLDIVCRTLFGAGDEVIVLGPYWPLIRGIVTSCGAEAVELPFFTELARSDFDVRQALASVVSPRTAGIYVNHPHNPTGAMLSAEHMDALAEFAEAHNLWVLSDDAYEHLYFGDQPAPALWMHPRLRERTVAAHTFSKSLGLAGGRVGFVHGPEAAMRSISGLQTFATYCAPRPMQVAVARALRSEEGRAWMRDARVQYQRAAVRTARALSLPQAPSGTFAFFDTRPFLRPGESPQQLLERCARAGIVLTPGAVTGRAYGDWARLCFTCVPPSTLDRAMDRLERELRRV